MLLFEEWIDPNGLNGSSNSRPATPELLDQDKSRSPTPVPRQATPKPYPSKPRSRDCRVAEVTSESDDAMPVDRAYHMRRTMAFEDS
ncbi:hypothetical protein NP233_g764 [Leucocoprinus birnbaumii]|uniref:Uncharacterized protein n=1 Tax=Leucocoprinus birnbaumii TaxID=56174 RepID=A0AAD5W3B9_9AGAR|nr:hypothetical protein NP233_g764 [Leucocoprinus birnbaumii]